MKTLYQILKVKKTSTTDEIQKAYRRLSMKHHPDRGGNPEQFAEISRAYEILSNPDRRRKYDETGETELFVDRSIHAMMACLAENAATLLKSCVEQGIDPKYLDVKRSLQELVESNREDINTKILLNRKQMDACDTITKKWSSTSETDYMKEVVRQRKDHLKLETDGLTEGLKVVEAVLKYLKTCTCTPEEMIRRHHWSVSTSGTTATSSSY